MIINRIANMVAFGHGHDSDFVPSYLTEEHADCLERYLAGEEVGIDLLRDCCAVDPVQPWRILAITFTNKAAEPSGSYPRGRGTGYPGCHLPFGLCAHPPPGDHPGGL